MDIARRLEIILGLPMDKKEENKDTDSNKFWSYLFHELAYILYGYIGKIDKITEEEKKRADELARNIERSEIPEEFFREEHLKNSCSFPIIELQKEN